MLLTFSSLIEQVRLGPSIKPPPVIIKFVILLKTSIFLRKKVVSIVGGIRILMEQSTPSYGWLHIQTPEINRNISFNK